jgi:hypothetical protein
MRFWAAIIGLLWGLLAQAADCQLSGSVCVDTSATKNVSGVTVNLGGGRRLLGVRGHLHLPQAQCRQLLPAIR